MKTMGYLLKEQNIFRTQNCSLSLVRICHFISHWFSKFGDSKALCKINFVLTSNVESVKTALIKTEISGILLPLPLNAIPQDPEATPGCPKKPQTY